MQNKISETSFSIKNFILNPENKPIIFLWVFILLSIFALSYLYEFKQGLLDINNVNMNLFLKKHRPNISTVQSSDSTKNYLLRDYYVMSSYNSCCGGQIDNDYVDLKPLKTVLKHGARALDFEIYSLNGEPVIGAGPNYEMDEKIFLKGTYNHLTLDQVFNEIEKSGFGGGVSPNPEDPMFLHFRMKTNNSNLHKTLYKKIKQYFSKRLLPIRYGFEGKHATRDQNFGRIPLLQAKNKIIIIMNEPKKLYKNTPMQEIINLSNDMPNYKSFTNQNITFAHEPTEIKNNNKKNFAGSFPDITSTTKNFNPAIHHKYGVQLAFMKFNIQDESLKYYINHFYRNGSAYSLKPPELRYQVKTIDPPKKQNPAVSYKEKNLDLPMYNNTI